jgi:hypothetical protein
VSLLGPPGKQKACAQAGFEAGFWALPAPVFRVRDPTPPTVFGKFDA